MADIVISIPDGLLPGLNKLVGRYNGDQGTDWDVPRFLREHVLELAMQDEIAAEVNRLQAQAQRDVQAAVGGTA
jgi:hypothetical protein